MSELLLDRAGRRRSPATCSASSTDRRAAGTGPVRPPERSFAGPPYCSGEAFSIPGVERSTRRWWGSRD
jgi:hypothetical protein